MVEFVHENAWILTFWGVIALLGALEFLFPQYPEHADRTRRWPTNFGLSILNGLIASLTPVLSVSSAQWAASNGIGLLNWVAAPWWLELSSTLLIVSGAQYAFHRYFHKNSILWRVHRVHHCDVHLDVSSALRFHPLEMIAVIAFMVPIIMVCGLSAATLAGYEIIQVIVGMITHANLRIPGAVDRIARQLFVTPGIHRIHHSADPAEFNSNYGNVLVLWDQLFRTYEIGSSRGPESRRYGLEEISGERAGNFIYLLELPWYTITSGAASAPRKGRFR